MKERRHNAYAAIFPEHFPPFRLCALATFLNNIKSARELWEHPLMRRVETVEERRNPELSTVRVTGKSNVEAERIVEILFLRSMRQKKRQFLLFADVREGLALNLPPHIYPPARAFPIVADTAHK